MKISPVFSSIYHRQPNSGQFKGHTRRSTTHCLSIVLDNWQLKISYIRDLGFNSIPSGFSRTKIYTLLQTVTARESRTFNCNIFASLAVLSRFSSLAAFVTNIIWKFPWTYFLYIKHISRPRETRYYCLRQFCASHPTKVATMWFRGQMFCDVLEFDCIFKYVCTSNAQREETRTYLYLVYFIRILC